jgi:hypothetical protein
MKIEPKNVNEAAKGHSLFFEIFFENCLLKLILHRQHDAVVSESMIYMGL